MFTVVEIEHKFFCPFVFVVLLLTSHSAQKFYLFVVVVVVVVIIIIRTEIHVSPFILFSAREWAEFNKSFNLIGSWSRRNFLIRTATVGGIR